MLSYFEVRKRFDAYFSENLSFPLVPKGLYQPCDYILEDSGKRIRPSLALLSAQLFQDDISEDVYKTALALELFHNFTLIHDDIMDDAPLRRGKPTIHEKYDVATAILSGDVMNIYSYKILSSINNKYLKEILDLFNITAIQVCEGQQLDMDFESMMRVSIDDYLEMIRLKTSVLLGCSMQSGAILSNASSEDASTLYEIGLNLGMAFQLQDDFLDTFGDQYNTGKSIGGDIVANKKTFLFLKALELSENNLSEEILIQDFPDPNIKISKTINIFKELGIDHITKSLIHNYFDKSLSALESLQIGKFRKQPLLELIHSLIERKK